MNDPAPFLAAEPVEDISGPELVRLSPRVAEAGAMMPAEAPLRIDLRLPEGVVLHGNGSASARHKRVDGSILQLEIPVEQSALVDETPTQGSIGLLDAPRYCTLGEACEHTDSTPGRWRAWRIREGTSARTELQLGPGRASRMRSGSMRAAARVVALWLGEDAPPLTSEDRIQFTYVGRLPRRATHWLAPPHDQWRPRVRYLQPGEPCAEGEEVCWKTLPSDDVQGVRLDGQSPAFVRVIAPLDAVAGEPTSVKVTTLDVHSNPTRVTEDIDLRDQHGELLGSVTLDNTWTTTLALIPPEPGMLSVRADSGLEARHLHHWTMVHPVGSRPIRRLAGDMHAHTSRSADASFEASTGSNDHRGGFSRPAPAYDYLRAVAGFDWGALSEHASDHVAYTLPPGPEFDLFREGGLCAIHDDRSSMEADWWTASQDISRGYDASHDDFVTFPAFEWHGFWMLGGLRVPLHRIIMFKDHDGSLPMLPGTTANRAPQCLLRFLELTERSPADTLVFTHMMDKNRENRDWDLTYRPAPPYDTMVAPDAAERWIRGVEIFSTHNPYTPGKGSLTAYEGPDEPSDHAWSARYGWRDTEAVIGLLGASDDHTATPGSDDLWPLPPRKPTFDHHPGGITVALAASQDRQDIFNALHARATYATTGPRAWLDVQIAHGDQPVRMGEEIGPVRACSLSQTVQLMVGRGIREVGVYGVQVGQHDPYLLVDAHVGWRREHIRARHRLLNPVKPGEPGETWLYYVRAFLGENAPGGGPEDHRDAVWSTPIWVDWVDGDCTSPRAKK